MHHEMILCHARTHTHTHKRTRTHTHAHTHTRTRTHIYTQNHGAVLGYRALFLSIRTQGPVFRSNRYVQIHQKPLLSMRIALSVDQNTINPFRANSQQTVGFDSVEKTRYMILLTQIQGSFDRKKSLLMYLKVSVDIFVTCIRVISDKKTLRGTECGRTGTVVQL